MAFYRIKHIKKKDNLKRYSYVYLVKSIWNKKKKECRQKVLRYIGKAENLEPWSVQEVYDRDGYICKICGTSKELVVDHIIPTSRGGTNELNNLQVLCSLCNKKKGSD